MDIVFYSLQATSLYDAASNGNSQSSHISIGITESQLCEAEFAKRHFNLLQVEGGLCYYHGIIRLGYLAKHIFWEMLADIMSIRC
jgi:hypothetical protein